MAGPASNISTLGVIGKELGKRALVAYLSGVTVVALITGYCVDYLVTVMEINVLIQIDKGHQVVPAFISWLALIILVGVFIRLKVMTVRDKYSQSKQHTLNH